MSREPFLQRASAHVTHNLSIFNDPSGRPIPQAGASRSTRDKIEYSAFLPYTSLSGWLFELRRVLRECIHEGGISQKAKEEHQR